MLCMKKNKSFKYFNKKLSPSVQLSMTSCLQRKMSIALEIALDCLEFHGSSKT